MQKITTPDPKVETAWYAYALTVYSLVSILLSWGCKVLLVS